MATYSGAITLSTTLQEQVLSGTSSFTIGANTTGRRIIRIKNQFVISTGNGQIQVMPQVFSTVDGVWRDALFGGAGGINLFGSTTYTANTSYNPWGVTPAIFQNLVASGFCLPGNQVVSNGDTSSVAWPDNGETGLNLNNANVPFVLVPNTRLLMTYNVTSSRLYWSQEDEFSS